MKLFPLVGILGHRQVGKTTFLEANSKSYYVVDRPGELKEARLDPEAYLKKRAGRATALDECQMAPELFPELKEWVRKHKSPGQFILSGSVRFTSREAITESLTGRIANLELLPMTISEQESLPLGTALLKSMESGSFARFCVDNPIDAKRSALIHKRVPQYMQSGGLPGICFLRDQKQRGLKINEQLNTILDRDLRLVKNVQVPFTDIKRFVEILANLQGTPVDFTDLKRRSGLSTPTIKKLLFVLEAVFLIRRIPIEGSTAGFVVFFEDQGERSILCTEKPSLESKLIHLCFVHLRTQLVYKTGELFRTFQYRTRGGALIPLAYASERSTLGILPMNDDSTVSEHSGSIKSFLATYANSKVLVLHTNPRGEYHAQNSRVLMAPMGAIF